jgi:hypothetical protein
MACALGTFVSIFAVTLVYLPACVVAKDVLGFPGSFVNTQVRLPMNRFQFVLCVLIQAPYFLRGQSILLVQMYRMPSTHLISVGRSVPTMYVSPFFRDDDPSLSMLDLMRDSVHTHEPL